MKKIIKAILIIAMSSSFIAFVGCKDANEKEAVSKSSISVTIPDGVYTGSLSKQDGSSAELKLTIVRNVIVSATLDGNDYPYITRVRDEYRGNLRDAVDCAQSKSLEYPCVTILKVEGDAGTNEGELGGAYYIIFYDNELEDGGCWYDDIENRGE
ncbi:MAG: hypothetical protein IJ759_01035 [Bacteroidales bacterium]|nr:hypothetical protein [Bacteroidales bacterium]